MIVTDELKHTRCAICQTQAGATELYPANFDYEDLNPAVFSARRLPDRIHYRMVRCDRCGLVRSDPVAGEELLARLYRQSTFDYGEQVPDLRRTYGRYLARLDRFGVRRGALLEIGCGNGFFLEEAQSHGYSTVQGVEPSAAAAAKARADIALYITCDIMHSGLFGPDRFDVVCMFQVFDHIADPGALLDDCLEVLKPGGLLLGLNHNLEAVSARLLGERSPIVDIEHTYLYSPATMSQLLEVRGFDVLEAGPVYNTYALNYLLRLVPLPGWLKRPALAALHVVGLGRVRFRVPLGNLYVIARKPR